MKGIFCCTTVCPMDMAIGDCVGMIYSSALPNEGELIPTDLYELTIPPPVSKAMGLEALPVNWFSSRALNPCRLREWMLAM